MEFMVCMELRRGIRVHCEVRCFDKGIQDDLTCLHVLVGWMGSF